MNNNYKDNIENENSDDMLYYCNNDEDDFHAML